MADDRYDAIVVGASFAGLAAAGQFIGSGRVLLVDHQPVGASTACDKHAAGRARRAKAHHRAGRDKHANGPCPGCGRGARTEHNQAAQ